VSTAPAVAPALAVRPGAVVRAGMWAGLLAAVAAIVTLALIAEISAAATAVPGIGSSTWTPITATTALVFGADAFHGSFAVLSIGAGLILLLAAGALLGILGVAWIVVCAGPQPSALMAMTLGIAYGLAAEIAVVNVLVGWIDGDGILYDALPSWGWWAALAVYGATLGLLVSRRGVAP